MKRIYWPIVWCGVIAAIIGGVKFAFGDEFSVCRPNQAPYVCRDDGWLFSTPCKGEEAFRCDRPLIPLCEQYDRWKSMTHDDVPDMTKLCEGL